MNYKRRAAVVIMASVLASSAGAGSATSAADQAPRKPNILVLMTDDQTLEALRVMPNVRALIGATGTIFSNSFVSYPQCCPSRATMLTGQYAHNHGVLSNDEPNGGYYRLDHNNTLPVWLQQSGYRTALIGKYLNGYGTKDPREVPPGWQEWHGLVDPSTYSYLGYTVNENGTLVTYKPDQSLYQTDVLARKTIDIIRRPAEGRPFFIWTTFVAPHGGGPVEADDPKGMSTPARAARHVGRFAREPLPIPASFNEADITDKPCLSRCRPLLNAQQIAEITVNYRQELESLLAVDEAVKDIFAALAASNQLSNTVVIFTSDNGYFHGEHRVPQGKQLPYEPSIRVPLLMRGPGIPSRTTVDSLVVNVDLAPTIVDLAGAVSGRRMDGSSLMPLLRDPRAPWRQDFIIERGTQPMATFDARFSGVRSTRFTYVEHATGQAELYDLAIDADQLQNRAGDPRYRLVQAVLRSRLRVLLDQQVDAGPGYTLVAADGGIFAFGADSFHGSAAALPLNAPAKGMARTPTGGGYWLVARDGGVFSFGDAPFLGSMRESSLVAPMQNVAADASGLGYWLVAADGGVFAFGVPFLGSTGAMKLNSPVVDIVPSQSGLGYRLVAADGGVFAFGDATFHGSTGHLRLNAPIVTAASTPTGRGYWLVAADGGVFAFGDATFHGSTSDIALNAPITGVTGTATGHGYGLVAADGGVFTFGDATFVGSAGGRRLNSPVVGASTSS